VDKRSRPSTLLFVGAVDQAPQLTQIYQDLRHQTATAPVQCARWREGMETFKELPSHVETRVTRFVRSNREDVSHRRTFLVYPGAETSSLATVTSVSPRWHWCCRWWRSYGRLTGIDRNQSSRTTPDCTPHVDPARLWSRVGNLWPLPSGRPLLSNRHWRIWTWLKCRVWTLRRSPGNRRSRHWRIHARLEGVNLRWPP